MNKTIGARLRSVVLVLAVSVGLSGQADPKPPQPLAKKTSPKSPSGPGLPSDTQKWACRETPATKQEIKAWCSAHLYRGHPIHDDLLQNPPPPVSDFARYNEYSERLKTFLTGKEYRTLGWIADKNWRFSGPSVIPLNDPTDYSHNYGPHFPLRVYYSPEVVDWLCDGRQGEIPDGAMIIKEMAVFSPTVKYLDISVDPDDDCMELKPDIQTPFGPQPIPPTLWAPILKWKGSSHDGWLWMLQSVDVPFPPQFPPPLSEASAFTLENLPTPAKDDDCHSPSPLSQNCSWYPTGTILQDQIEKLPNVAMLNPLAGFPYCLSCHSTAESHSTFASMDNILGKELRYKVFKETSAPPPAPTPTSLKPFPRPLSEPSQAFKTAFDQLPPVDFGDVWKTRMPAETYEQQVTSAQGGPAQFLTAAQCSACHSATPQSPLLPHMAFVDDERGRSSRLRNLSPYGEWRVSPMGLAGRDPVFFSQLQGETNNLSQHTACIENTCLHCHGVMGQRQLAIDTQIKGAAPCKDMFAVAPPPGIPFGTPLKRDVLKQWPGSTPSDDQLYGSLARDGISCTTCHHIDQKELGKERTFTGNFVTGKPDEIHGPYKSGSVVTKPMEHALGLTPKFGEQISSSELCSSCHAVLLPVFANSGERLGDKYEQSTYLEWLNSDSARQGPQYRSCQDCHMQTHYKGQQLKFKIANSESNDAFPPTTHRLPDKDIELTERSKFSRHSLHGLNLFLNQFFQQFPLLLGFQQVDWMSEQPSPLDPPAPPFKDNYVMELPLFTGMESMLEMAKNDTATVDIGSLQETQDGQLRGVVTVRNLTGHYLPTGVGFRRMFLQLLVLDEGGDTLWASGRTNELGFLLDGKTDNVLESEQPLKFPNAPIQPHYQRISSGNQVQIYQELIRDSAGALTTSFLRRVTLIKDNRLRPKGFDPREFTKSPSPYIRELANLHGEEARDPSYVDPGLTGSDSIEYRIPLGPQLLAQAHHVEATLYYQSLPPSYLQERFNDASRGPKRKDDIERLYYMTSNLNVAEAKNEKAEPVLNGWKLRISGDVQNVR